MTIEAHLDGNRLAEVLDRMGHDDAAYVTGVFHERPAPEGADDGTRNAQDPRLAEGDHVPARSIGDVPSDLATHHRCPALVGHRPQPAGPVLHDEVTKTTPLLCRP